MGQLTTTGTTLVLGTQGITFELLDISGVGEEAADIDGTHMGSTTGVHAPDGITEAGELSATVFFDGTVDPIVGGAVETFTIDYAGGGKTRAASGYIKPFKPSGSLHGRFTAELVVQLTGAVTAVII